MTKPEMTRPQETAACAIRDASAELRGLSLDIHAHAAVSWGLVISGLVIAAPFPVARSA